MVKTRTLVGLLAASGALMSCVASLVHGVLWGAVVVACALALGFAAYLAAPNDNKKKFVAAALSRIQIFPRMSSSNVGTVRRPSPLTGRGTLRRDDYAVGVLGMLTLADKHQPPRGPHESHTHRASSRE